MSFCKLSIISGLALGVSMPALALDHAQVFERVKTSVVSVEAQQLPDEESPETVPQLNHGWGVLVDNGQEIMTTASVVQTADWIEITTQFDDVTSARVRSSATQADVAFLDLEHQLTKPVSAVIGNSDKIKPGDSVFVVHLSSGLRPAIITGRVSACVKPDMVMGPLLQGEFFQTDVVLTSNDAGAPMFNDQGELIGLVTNVLSEAEGFKGMGFAIPINLARKLTMNGSSFWTGLSGRLIDGKLAQTFELPQAHGLLIERISHYSPAARLGLRGGNRPETIEGQKMIVGGDVVLAVDDIAVDGPGGLTKIRQHLQNAVIGAPITVVVWREKKVQKLSGALER